MSYTHTVNQVWYRIKDESKVYPWPSKMSPDRTITIRNSDVLTRCENGTYQKCNGLCCFGIVIPSEDLEAKEPGEIILFTGST